MWVWVWVELIIDPVTFAGSITEALGSNWNREGFVQTALAEAFEKSGRSYNVMVCNMSLKPDYIGLQGVQFFQSFTCDTKFEGSIPYGVWVFESGKFVKPGDGGDINWAFIGKFQRELNSGTVTFFK